MAGRGEAQRGAGHQVVLNVGGTCFHTTAEALARVPGSRLAGLDPADASYQPDSAQYYFDRNPRVFCYILDLYRCGSLHFPSCFCTEYIEQELHFWQIDVSSIAACCLRRLQHAKTDQEKLDDMELKLQDTYIKHADTSDEPSLKITIWTTLENPFSSKCAMVWGVFVVLAVCLAVAVQCMYTHSAFRVPIESKMNVENETNPKVIMLMTTDLHPILFWTEEACLLVFLIEIVGRFFTCPNKLKFFFSLYNIVDLIGVASMVAFTAMHWAILHVGEVSRSLLSAMFFITLLGIFRVFRLIKFSRHFTGMKVLILALQASSWEIALLILIISIGTLIFSTLIYFAEFYSDKAGFENIPIGFWWAIVTMTTVGYGDKHPSTAWGYTVGGLCAISGMLCMGLPIPIIANNFHTIYAQAKVSNRKNAAIVETNAKSVFTKVRPVSQINVTNGNVGQTNEITSTFNTMM